MDFTQIDLGKNFIKQPAKVIPYDFVFSFRIILKKD